MKTKKTLTAILVVLCLMMFQTSVFADTNTNEESPIVKQTNNTFEIVIPPNESLDIAYAENTNQSVSSRVLSGSGTVEIKLDSFAWSGWIYSANKWTNHLLTFWQSGTGKVDIEVYFAGSLHASRAIVDDQSWEVLAPYNVGQVNVRINNNSSSTRTIKFTVMDVYA